MQLKKVNILAKQHLTAGGLQSMAEDREVAARVKDYRPNAVGITVKSWESPMLDLLDFTSLLREMLGKGCPIILLLAPLPEQVVNAAQIEAWESALSPAQDPDLYIEAL